MAKKKSTTKRPDIGENHPLFGYRVTTKIKENLKGRLEAALEKTNIERENNNQKPLKKNDIFVDALEKGLNQLESEIGGMGRK